jgi:ribonuclease HI
MKIILYSDGAAKSNPNGPGAWGCVILYPSGQTAEHCGYIGDKVSNNFCELTAVYEGLRRIDPESSTVIFTDSQYVVNSVNKGWLKSWSKNDWKTARGKPVANKELWVKILSMIEKRDLKFEWVKGHNGDPLNERADKLANMAIFNNKNNMC